MTAARRASVALGTAAAVLVSPLHMAPLRAQDSLARAASAPSFYDGRTAVPFTLTANFGVLRRDRQAEPPWRAATLTVADSAGAPVVLPVRVRTRGIWRRNNCQMPPLRLDIVRASARRTPLAGVNRPKLVHHCHDQSRAEQYILSELQLYRIYQLLTPFSHRARLVRVTYADSGSGKVRTTRYGFLLEEPQAMAQRIGAQEMTVKGLVSDDLDARTRFVMGLFQFMIGNTDWSTGGLHNVELFTRDGTVYPVAYDFDYSGAVDAHYAVPPPQVRIRSVTQRIYRGACASDAVVAEVVAAFRGNRDAIRALYADEVGRLMDPAVVRRTLAYFDAFYEVLDNPRGFQREVLGRCVASQ